MSCNPVLTASLSRSVASCSVSSGRGLDLRAGLEASFDAAARFGPGGLRPLRRRDEPERVHERREIPCEDRRTGRAFGSGNEPPEPELRCRPDDCAEIVRQRLLKIADKCPEHRTLSFAFGDLGIPLSQNNQECIPLAG